MTDCERTRSVLFSLKLDLLETEESARIQQHLVDCAVCNAEYDAMETKSIEPIVRALFRERLVRRTMRRLVASEHVLCSDDQSTKTYSPLGTLKPYVASPELDSLKQLDNNRPTLRKNNKLVTRERLIMVAGSIAATIVFGLFVANLSRNQGTIGNVLSPPQDLANATLADIEQRAASLRTRGQSSDAEILLREFISVRDERASPSEIAQAHLILVSTLRARAEDLVRPWRKDENAANARNPQPHADMLMAVRSLYRDAAQLLLHADDLIDDTEAIKAQLGKELASLYADWRTVDSEVTTDLIANELRQRLEKTTAAPP